MLGGGIIGKMVLLTLNEHEKTVIDKIIAAISDYIQLEPMEITPVSVLSFPGLEIRHNQHRVFMDGEKVNLTRLEYSVLVFLAANPALFSRKSRYLKLFGTWIAIAAIRALST